MFCITVVLLTVCVPAEKLDLKVDGSKLNIRAAVIAQTVRSTLICDVLFITCNVTQRHDSRYYWQVGRFTQRSRWSVSAYLITESRLERRLTSVLHDNNCKITHYFT